MPFTPPSWVPELPYDIPDTLSAEDFIFNEHYRSRPLRESKAPFVDGLSGRSYNVHEARQRIDYLSRELSSRLQWHPNTGSPLDKVVAIYTLDSIDTMTLAWAVHRVGGVCLSAHPTSTGVELRRQLQVTGCRTIFTCTPLLPLCLSATSELQFAGNQIFLLDDPSDTAASSGSHTSVEELIQKGKTLEEIEKPKWSRGQGTVQPAFLCSSSGTSGTQKMVKVSHKNVIANVIQQTVFESVAKQSSSSPETCLTVIPQSHAATLVMCHTMVFRGDSIVVLPKFDMFKMLKAVQQFQVDRLFLIPPIIAPLVSHPAMFSSFDIGSVSSIVVGALSLDPQVQGALEKQRPGLKLFTAYAGAVCRRNVVFHLNGTDVYARIGMTESFTVLSYTNNEHRMAGSAGCLLPGVEARLVSNDGKEITDHNRAGELVVASPSVVLGYFEPETESTSTFTKEHWLRTGDLVEVRAAPDGTEHLFVVDRLKDVIKVKGVQVTPTELEALLLSHPAVAEAAVVAVADDVSGELPKAFIVRKAGDASTQDVESLRESIDTFVQERVPQHKWLKGGIEFLDAIPKGGNGKPLRRLLRARKS